MKQITLLITLFICCLSLQAQAPESAEKATIYFHRPSVKSASLGLAFFDGSEIIGRTTNSNYLKYECEPGEHLFTVFLIKTDNKTSLNLDVTPGAIYYIDTEIAFGGKLQLVDARDGNASRLEKIQKKTRKKDSQEQDAEKLTKYQDKYNDQIIAIVATGGTTDSTEEKISRRPTSSVNSILGSLAARRSSRRRSRKVQEITTIDDSAYKYMSTDDLIKARNKANEEGDTSAFTALNNVILKRVGVITEEKTERATTPINDPREEEQVEEVVTPATIISSENKPRISPNLPAGSQEEKVFLEMDMDVLKLTRENAQKTGDSSTFEIMNDVINYRNNKNPQSSSLSGLTIKNEDARVEATNNNTTTETVAVAYTPTTTEDTLEGLTNASNKREASLIQLMESAGVTSSSDVPLSRGVVATEESYGKVRRSSSNDNATEIKYRRSSLYTLMVQDNSREHAETIKNAFGNSEISEKFNDHNIGPYYIEGAGAQKDQTGLIEGFVNTSQIAKRLVAKWFNRNEKGEFNMDLVAQRGEYNASELDVTLANSTERGSAMLADAGEELIKNTFVIVNDYKFTNKEEVAKKASGWLSAISSVASYIPGGSTISNVADGVNLATQVAGKGYIIKSSSYLYQLVWDEETAARFYTECWVDKNNFDPTKKEAFDQADFFRLKLVGSENAWADLQSTIFTKKSEEDLITIATVKSTDKAIAKLQKKFEQFRTKTPLISVDPIAAKIGLKEGLEKGDKFEVLEQLLNEDGTTRYKRVAVIKVDKNNIWDNRFMATEAGERSENEYTIFTGSKKKIQAGMLIRQIN